MSTSRKRTLFVGALAAVVVAVGVVLWWVVNRSEPVRELDELTLHRDNTSLLGDANGDDRVDEHERVALEGVTTAAATLSQANAVPAGANTLLLAPPTPAWWALVTGLSAQTVSWGTTAPQGAEWFAYSESREPADAAGVDKPYDAITIAFTDHGSYEAWVTQAADQGLFATSHIIERDNVATIFPGMIHDSIDSLPAIDVANLAQVKVGLGYWRIDFSQHIDDRAADSVLPEVYRTVFDKLGFARAGVWEATSAHPNALWRGTVEGFDPDSVDTVNAVGDINVSYIQCQDFGGTHDCLGAEGLAEASNMLYALDADGAGGGDVALKPAHAPDGADLVLALGAGFRGAVNGSFGWVKSPIRQMNYWAQGTVLTIHPVMALDEVSLAKN